MKKFSIGVAVLLAAMSVHAEDPVLPSNVKPLLPAGVELQITYLNENIQSRTKEEQPIVKSCLTLYFAATDAEHGTELWKYDYTTKTASMVADINPGAASSNPKWMTVAQDHRVYFQADNGENGAELWVTDGTEEGTTMVMDIYPDAVGSEPQAMTAYKDKILFFAMDEESEWDPVRKDGAEKWLWITDGTEAGTERIGNTPTKHTIDGTRGVIVIANGYGIFAGYSKEYNSTIWSTDGTAAGTKPLLNINTKPDSAGVFDTQAAAIEHLVSIDGRLAAFRATTNKDKTGDVIDWGTEVWMSDGTTAGTKPIGFPINREEDAGALASSNFRQTYPIKNHLYFRATNGANVNGQEPWIWDIDQPIVEGQNPRLIQDCAHNKNVYKYNSHTSCFYEYKDYLYLATNFTYNIETTDPTTGEPTTKMWDSGYHRLCRAKLTDVWDVNSAELKPVQGEYLWTGFEIGNTPSVPARMLAGGEARKAAAAMQPFTHKFCTVNDTLFFVCRDSDDPQNYELWKLDSKTPGSKEFDKPVKVMDLPDDGQLSYPIQMRQQLYIASASQKQLYVYEMTNVIVPYDDDEPTGLINVNANENVNVIRKVVENGQVYILKDNQKISVLGTSIQ